MVSMDIEDEVYKQWVKFYEKQDMLIYPTLKNFTARKLKDLMEKKEVDKDGNINS